LTQALVQHFQQQIQSAYETEMPLCIQGGNSKAFYGHDVSGEILDVSQNAGVISYEPTELVITVRAGTTVAEINQVLAAENQILPFDPPCFTEATTIGGAVACGLTGPGRPYIGATRDFILGIKTVSGKGEIMSFGGQVMKNVAGYDVSRLMSGSFGTLGVLLEVSLKVLPKPDYEMTVIGRFNAEEAIHLMNQWAGQPFPISATSYEQEQLFIRLSGHKKAVLSAKEKLQLVEYSDDDFSWDRLRDQQHNFFKEAKTLWRLSIPSATKKLLLDEKQLIEWGGALRWLDSNEPAEQLREMITQVGGQATLFRTGKKIAEIFHPLSEGIKKIHIGLKDAFDPKNILNRGKLYRDV
jgi:glycolate oxidase FAD binding subunit